MLIKSRTIVRKWVFNWKSFANERTKTIIKIGKKILTLLFYVYLSFINYQLTYMFALDKLTSVTQQEAKSVQPDKN